LDRGLPQVEEFLTTYLVRIIKYKHVKKKFFLVIIQK